MKYDDSSKLEKKAAGVASLLKVMANPFRLMILCGLVRGEQSAGELWLNSTLSQSAFSQHLAVLRKKKVVKTRKEAQTVYYSLSDEKVVSLLEKLYQLYCQN